VNSLDYSKIITGNIGDDSISFVDYKDPSNVEILYLKELLDINNKLGPKAISINKKQQLLVLNSYDESLIILDMYKREVIMKISLGRFPIAIKSHNERVFILNCDSNSLSIFDEHEMLVIEEIYLDEKPSDLQLDIEMNKAYIANTNSNNICIIDLLDYSITKIDLNIEPFRIIIDEEYVYILSNANNGSLGYSSISVLNKETSELCSYKIKGIFIDFVLIEDRLLLTNPEDGYLYSFSLDDKVIEKYIYLCDMPYRIIWDKSKIVYITDLINNQLLIVDLKKSKITYRVNVGKEPETLYLL